MAATDLLTLTEARDAIRARSGDTSCDDLLRDVYIPGVTTVVEDIIGAVVTRTVTATFDGGRRVLTLDPGPVFSITSIAENGTTLVAGTDYVANTATAAIVRGTALSTRKWGAGLGAITIVYLAGRVATTAAVDGAIKMAARIILANEWQNDRTGNRPDLGGNVDNATVQTASGHVVPRRAVTYLAAFDDDDALPSIGGV